MGDSPTLSNQIRRLERSRKFDSRDNASPLILLTWLVRLLSNLVRLHVLFVQNVILFLANVFSSSKIFIDYMFLYLFTTVPNEIALKYPVVWGMLIYQASIMMY